ncbi:MAG: hypothetical protein U0441_05940 [Polyangiaceae bacterium]
MSTRAVLALAAALAIGAFGCQQSTDSESDGEEDVAQAAQHLDPADGADDTDDSAPTQVHGTDCMNGSPHEDPQPQPWHYGQSNDSGKPGGSNPLDSSTKTSIVPVTGRR